MTRAHFIIQSPIVTEKALKDRPRGYYWFWVNPTATKDQIAVSFKEIFKHPALSVRTSTLKGKVKTNWNTRKTTVKPTRKKALVIVAKDKKLDILELKKD